MTALFKMHHMNLFLCVNAHKRAWILIHSATTQSRSAGLFFCVHISIVMEIIFESVLLMDNIAAKIMF